MPDAFAPNGDRPGPLAAYTFGRFVLYPRERLLLAEGVPVEIGSRAVEILLALVKADGRLLTKEALLDEVWPGVIVEENNLQVQISALRRALGPFRDWIATVPGRGYRFTGPVAALSEADAEATPSCRARQSRHRRCRSSCCLLPAAATALRGSGSPMP